MRRMHAQAGFTLAELMIAIALGLIIVAAVIQVFVANKTSYRLIEGNVSIQDNAILALLLSKQTLEMSGYKSEYEAMAMITRKNSDVGVLPSRSKFVPDTAPIRLLDNSADDSTKSAASLVSASNVKAGTDFLIFRSRGHQDQNLHSLCSGEPVGSATTSIGLSNYIIEYMFYVDNNDQYMCYEQQFELSNDAYPPSAASSQSNKLASNVVDLQFDVGVLDSATNSFTFQSIENAFDYDELYSVRINMLVRSDQPVGSVNAGSAITMLNSGIASSTTDGYLYRQFQQNVILENQPL